LERVAVAVVNGRVWPGPPGRCGIAIAADRIVAVGTDDEIRGLAGPGTAMIDAAGGLIMPGFNDAHVHFLMGARNLRNLELSGETTVDGILKRVADFAQAHNDRDWLLGRGWFYAVFPGGMPHRELLDRVVPDRPMAIEAYDSHTTWVNSAALARLGITDDTADPPRGEIQRDGAGHPTGIVKAFADGVIETGTAAMLAPYEGKRASDPGALGHPQWEPGELREAIRVADAAGWQVQVHAIGDAAVRTALDAYERAATSGTR